MTYRRIQDQRQSRKHSHHGIFSQDGMAFGAGEILKTVKGVVGRTVAYTLHSPSCIMLVSLRPHTYIMRGTAVSRAPRLPLATVCAVSSLRRDHATSASSPSPGKINRVHSRTRYLLVAGTAALSFGAGVLFSSREGSRTAAEFCANQPRYGGPDELKAAIGDLEQIFSDRSGTVSTDVSDTDTHARWFTGRKPGQSSF